MPVGPKGHRRPGDVIGAPIKVPKIAIGEIEDDTGTDDGKDKAAQALGRKGGNARAERMTPAQRAEAARKAENKRLHSK